MSAADATRTAEGTIAGTAATCPRSRRRKGGRCALGRLQPRCGALRADLASERFEEHDCGNHEPVLRDNHAGSTPLSWRVSSTGVGRRTPLTISDDGGGASALEDVARANLDREPSIAVSPFANLSADKETVLQRWPRRGDHQRAHADSGAASDCLYVCVRFSRQGAGLRKIAEALDVRTVLEGSVVWPAPHSRDREPITPPMGITSGRSATTGNWQTSSPCRTKSPRRLPSSPGETGRRICRTQAVHAEPSVLRGVPQGAARVAKVDARRDGAQQGMVPTGHCTRPGLRARTQHVRLPLAQLANYGLLPAHEAMPLVRSEARKALAIDPSLPEDTPRWASSPGSTITTGRRQPDDSSSRWPAIRCRPRSP